MSAGRHRAGNLLSFVPATAACLVPAGDRIRVEYGARDLVKTTVRPFLHTGATIPALCCNPHRKTCSTSHALQRRRRLGPRRAPDADRGLRSELLARHLRLERGTAGGKGRPGRHRRRAASHDQRRYHHRNGGNRRGRRHCRLPGWGAAGSALGALGGTIAGATVGSVVGHATGDTDGFEYIVRKANSDLLSVTQKETAHLPIGAHVLVIQGPQARIVLDYTVPLPDLMPKAADTAKPTLAAPGVSPTTPASSAPAASQSSSTPPSPPTSSAPPASPDGPSKPESQPVPSPTIAVAPLPPPPEPQAAVAPAQTPPDKPSDKPPEPSQAGPAPSPGAPAAAANPGGS